MQKIIFTKEFLEDLQQNYGVHIEETDNYNDMTVVHFLSETDVAKTMSKISDLVFNQGVNCSVGMDIDREEGHFLIVETLPDEEDTEDW